MALEFDLHLNEPRDLFVFDAQSYDPFDEQALGESGFDYIVARILGFWFRAPLVRVRVWLPPAQWSPETEARMRVAMDGWCDDLVVANRRERTEFLINNTIFLFVALVVFALSMLAQQQLNRPGVIADEHFRDALVYGLDVLVWVALWTPFSALLLDWFPLFRRNQAYRALRNMDLTVRAAV